MPLQLTRAVKALLIACVAGFLIQQTWDHFFDGHLLSLFALVPAGFVIDHRFWQLVTYGFLHGDVIHLFFNLMLLAFIGGELEATWGTQKFLKYYFFCLVSAGVVYLLLSMFRDSGALGIPMVGASGAIYGLLIAYGLIFGERTLLFMMLFPLKAKHFIWILAAIEFMTTLFSPGGALASAAHLGGMAAGFAYLWIQAGISVARKRRQAQSFLPKARKRKASQHLKLVVSNKSKKSGKATSDDPPDSPTWH
jgi:membrane associated rhomboid family serine protease